MCAHLEHRKASPARARRNFVSPSSALAGTAFVAAGTLSGVADADAMKKTRRDKLTPDDILALIKKGNKRFSAGKRDAHNYLAQRFLPRLIMLG